MFRHEDNSRIYKFNLDDTQVFYNKLKERAERDKTHLLFKLTERSIELFKRAKPGQGLVGLIDLETGEIDLIPAYNKDDGRIREDFFYEEEKDGKRVTTNYRVESPYRLGTNTGIVHTAALALINKNVKPGIILGFGIFKGGKGAPVIELRNKSASQNSLTLEYSREFIFWAYQPFSTINESPITHLTRSICGEITKKLRDVLLHDLPRNEGQIAKISHGRIFSLEKAFSKLSKEEKREKIKENFFLSIYYNPEMALDMLSWFFNQNEHYSDDAEIKTLMLIAAAAAGRIDIVESLIYSGINPNRKDRKGNSPLIFAIANEHVAIEEMLMSVGASPLDTADRIKVLSIAARINRLNVIKKLLDEGAKLNKSEAFPLLIHAVKNNYSDLVCILLKHGANVNQSDDIGNTPLFHAIRRNAIHQNNKNIIEHLLNHGANVNLTNQAGITPLFYAVQNGHIEAIHAFCDAGADTNWTNSDGYTPLMLAAQKGHIAAVDELLRAQSDVAKMMAVSVPILLGFANKQNRHEQLESFLRKQHHGVIPPNLSEFTALHLAAFFGHTQIVATLLDKMVDVKIETLDYLSKIAKAMNHSEILSLLQLRLVKASCTEQLIDAAVNGDAKTIEALCSGPNKVDPNVITLNGWTPLIYAAEHGHAKVIKVLCDAGANPNLARPNGWTPLMSAAANGQAKAIKALCDAGANPNLINSNGCAPLMFAAQKGHIAAVNELLHAQADIAITAPAKLALLLASITNKDCHKKIKALLKKQINSDIPDMVSGFTALHLAVFFGHAQIVTTLLDKIVDAKIETLNYLCQIAEVMKHSETLSLLQSRIAKDRASNGRRLMSLMRKAAFRSVIEERNRNNYKEKHFLSINIGLTSTDYTYMLSNDSETIKRIATRLFRYCKNKTPSYLIADSPSAYYSKNYFGTSFEDAKKTAYEIESERAVFQSGRAMILEYEEISDDEFVLKEIYIVKAGEKLENESFLIHAKIETPATIKIEAAQNGYIAIKTDRGNRPKLGFFENSLESRERELNSNIDALIPRVSSQ